MRNTLFQTVATSVFLLPLPRFSRLPGTAAAVAAHTTSRASIAAAARASNMLGIEMAAAAITVAVAAITVEEITAGATIKATTIKAADRG
jgi:hypothetical protein